MVESRDVILCRIPSSTMSLKEMGISSHPPTAGESSHHHADNINQLIGIQLRAYIKV